MDHTLAIIGGGLAGMTLAGLLARQGWPVHLLEAQRLDAAAPPARDLRTLALAASSWDTLASLGIERTQLQTAPIRAVHVSYRGRPGRVLLNAEESGLPALGHTVNYGALLSALRGVVQGHPLVQVADGCTVTDVGGSAVAARIRWQDDTGTAQERLAPLAVIADGGSLSRRPAVLSWRYRQHALTCRVESDQAADGTAWERFTVDGPIALLPAHQGHALIWTGPADRIARLMAMGDAAFLAALQDWFGDRAGQFIRCSPRLSYPLGARFELHPAQRRVVRIANAAQALHPVAGQGFNLGLRDVNALVEVLAAQAGSDPGRPEMLHAYLARRTPDRQISSGLTHLLAELFALPLPGIGIGTSLAFAALDGSRGLRQRFARLMANGVSA